MVEKKVPPIEMILNLIRNNILSNFDLHGQSGLSSWSELLRLQIREFATAACNICKLL